jgi:hypothetical protein
VHRICTFTLDRPPEFAVVLSPAAGTTCPPRPR